MGKKKQKNDVLLAFRKANREIEFERNGGGQFQAKKIWKDKTKYSRKNLKKIDLGDFLFLISV